MARKKLNKKVLFIVIGLLFILAIGVIGTVLYLSRDPEKFIKDAQAAVKAAQQADDEETRFEKYEEAARNYNKARARMDTDEGKVDMLYKLVDIFIKTDQWNKVRGCWGKIASIDPQNYPARFNNLEYLYIMADDGASGAWKEIEKQATEFLNDANNPETILLSNVHKSELAEKALAKEDDLYNRLDTLGGYLHLIRGRANLEMAQMGGTTDPNKLLSTAVEDLEKASELEPGNVDTYWYLARAETLKGEMLASKGFVNEKEKALQRSIDLLEKAVEKNPENPTAHINLLNMEFNNIRQRGGSSEDLVELENDYLSMAEKFSSDGDVFFAICRYYASLGYEYFDNAIEAAQKMLELQSGNVQYAITAANLQYRKYSVFKRSQNSYDEGISKAVKLAEDALTYPDAQQNEGPGTYQRRTNKILLCDLLAKCYTEQVLEPTKELTESEKETFISKAENIVYQLEQLFGSGDEPHIIKWKGIIELSKGNHQEGIDKLYSVYQNYEAAGRRDPYLSYVLANAVKNTGQTGAYREFLYNALSRNQQSNGIISEKPYAMIDYAEVLYSLRAYPQSLNIINSFEENFWSNERTRSLKILSLISSNQLSQAKEEVNKLPFGKADTINLKIQLANKELEQFQRAAAGKESENDLSQQQSDLQITDVPLDELNQDLQAKRQEIFELVEKLLSEHPESANFSSVRSVARYYVQQDEIAKAEELIRKYLQSSPDDINAKLELKRLQSPDPSAVTDEELSDYRLKLLKEIENDTRRALSLGLFYMNNGDAGKAKEQFSVVLESETADGADLPDDVEEIDIKGSKSIAVSYLFEIAVDQNDYSYAEQICDIARRENLDGCKGHYFSARLSIAQEQYEQALERINRALKVRPLFGRAFMLRSQINLALGNNDAAITDIQKAVSLRPSDGDIARRQAIMLYQRNERLGDSASNAQIVEARNALLRAIRLNPTDGRLQSLYATYISRENPENALAILQRIQKSSPTVQNSLMLARQAMELALETTQQERKDFLFELAGSAFEDALEADADNETVLNAYAEYYRVLGEPEKAEQMLNQAGSKSALWRHYFSLGRLVKAKEILLDAYKQQPENLDLINGLITVSVSTQDKQAVQKYTDKLVKIEDNSQTRLVQVQALVNAGLLKQAEIKLQSLKEKYPNEPKAVLLEAFVSLRRGEFEKARKFANRTLEMDDKDNIAWRVRGMVNAMLGNYEQAVSDLKTSKTISAEPQTRLELAKTYLKMERYEDAITELESLISGEQAGGQFALQARRILEQVYSQLNREDSLRRFYQKMLTQIPESFYWYRQAANFAFSQQQYQQARELYSKALDNSKLSDGFDVSALEGYLQTYLAEDKYESLFEEAGEYLDTEAAYIVFYKMAQAKVEMDDVSGAVEYFKKAISEASANQDIVVSILQSMYNSLGQEQVLKICSEKLQANPDSLAANFVMFNLSKINGEYNQALNYIDKCIEQVSSDKNRMNSYLIQKVTVLQAAYNKTGDKNYLTEAVKLYKSMLEDMPNNVIVQNNLAYLLADNEIDLKKALEYAENVYQRMPDNPNFLDTYAYVLYQNEKFEKAEQIIQAAVQNTEQGRTQYSYEIYEHMGMIKAKLGKKEQAKQAYQMAIDIIKNSDRQDKDEVAERLELEIKKL